jgi:RNA polymerase sigma-70 factor, ECF subfamily
VDEVRRAARGRELYAKLSVTASTGAEERLEEAKLMRDDQMRLIFTCCHPALQVEHQVALTLRLMPASTSIR